MVLNKRLNLDSFQKPSLDSWEIIDSHQTLGSFKTQLSTVSLPYSLNSWHCLNQESQSWQFQKPNIDSWEICEKNNLILES